MSATSVEITGALNTEGVLTLDGKPQLPAGRVRVTLQPIDVDLTKTEIWQFLERLHAMQDASGERRTAEEIDADIEERRREEEEYDDYMERMRADVGRRNDPLPRP